MQIEYYDCVECQDQHETGDDLYEAHLHRQSKHGIKVRPKSTLVAEQDQQELYTKGDLVYDASTRCRFNVYSNDATGSIVATCDGFQYAPRPASEKEANARRFVACWNACKGIRTDELVQIASTGGMLGPREDIKRIAAKRNTLLEACRKALRVYESGNMNSENIGDVLYAAIAQGEG